MTSQHNAIRTDWLATQSEEPLDPAQLEADVRRLYASGDFEHIGYALLDESGRRVVSIDAAEKSWGPNFLQFALEGGYDLHGESRFEALAAYRRTWIDFKGFPVDVAPSGGLMTLSEDSAVLDAPVQTGG